MAGEELKASGQGDTARLAIVLGDFLYAQLLARALAVTGVFEVCAIHPGPDTRSAAKIAESGPDLLLLDLKPEGVARLADNLKAHEVRKPMLVLCRPADAPAYQDLSLDLPWALLDVTRSDCASLIESMLGLMGVADQSVWSRRPPTVPLSRRERDVLVLLSKGMDNLKIAAILGVTERAVKLHVSSLYRKLACENRIELALQGVEMELAAIQSDWHFTSRDSEAATGS